MRSYSIASILTLLMCGYTSAFAPTSVANGIKTSSMSFTSPASFHSQIHSSTHLALGRDDEPEVQVNEIGNIDATTLTAVGFGLIAFNFLVLANMGDGGIGGIIATFINTFG